MRWGGVLLLVFIVFHILHFTTGTVSRGACRAMYRREPHDVYGNVIVGFRIAVGRWRSTSWRCCSLGLHLFHGTWSSVRTLGARASRREHPLHRRHRAR